jgi:hypothetical protein
METKQMGVEWLLDQVKFIDKEVYAELYNQSFEHAKFIERENMLDFALFVKREGWALKTGKNIDDLYNDFLNK